VTVGNGINVHSIPLKQFKEYSGDNLEIICVSNLSPWHGIDRLLKGLAEYTGTTRVRVQIVGNGNEMENLKKMVAAYGLEDTVVFHGVLEKKDLDAVFDQCHIAAGSLGIHRIGLSQISALKCREYCARGIPFFCSASDTDFLQEFPFRLEVPSDDNPINIGHLIDFTRNIYRDAGHPDIMREYAVKHLDWKVKAQQLKQFFESIC
jgi:hypothetical protein